MSRNRYQLMRDENEPEIIEALEAIGCTVRKVNAEPYDLLVGRMGWTFAIEVKTPKGKLTPAQRLFQLNWRGQYAVVRSPAEALIAVGAVVA